MTQDYPAKESAADARRLELARAQRRQFRLSVFLPFLIMTAIFAVIIGTLLALRSPVQVSLVSNSALTALVLVPLVACMFPFVILSLILVALFSRWHSKSRSPLRRLEAWTAMFEQNAETWLGSVDERVLDWAVRLAPIRQLISTFDPPAAESLDEGSE
ncbi:MAG: hypothetical protein OXG68_14535 [Chloroflexi bacterium]|nr:hypothetical protein [Chloroflexota bacterium]